MICLRGVWGGVLFALYCLISGYGWEFGMLPCVRFVYASVLSGAMLVQFACAFVCLTVRGDLVGLRMLFRMVVCKFALVRLGGDPSFVVCDVVLWRS